MTKSTTKKSSKKAAKEAPKEEVKADAPVKLALVEDAPVEPKKEYEYDLNAPMTLIPLVADAWDAIRDKSDATYATADPNFRSALISHAHGVLSSGTVLKGDTYWSKFEKKIAQLTAK